MASDPILDIEKLVEPIPGENPSGEDLRTDTTPDSPYYRIKDARTAARRAESQLMEWELYYDPKRPPDEQEPKPDAPNWSPVLSNAPKALEEKSKNLEIVAYLIEALVRKHGFAGLRDGFRLARELVERFWDTLYPMPDEDGMQSRTTHLASLNGDDAEGTLEVPISKILITDEVADGPFSRIDYIQAVELDKVSDPEIKAKRVADGQVSMQAFERAVQASPAEFYVNLVEDLKAAQAEFELLEKALDEKCGLDSPPTSNIRNLLKDSLHTIESVARAKLPSEEDADDGSDDGETEAGDSGGGAPGTARASVPGAINTREDALKTLSRVAEFFRKTEPHTPLSYSLEQAVRWGQTPLPELLVELIADEAARADLFKRVGIRTESSEG